jgi:hypothetical protein
VRQLGRLVQERDEEVARLRQQLKAAQAPHSAGQVPD